MDDREFNTLAESTLARLESALERCEADLDFERQAEGILEIEFATGEKMIVNRHAGAQEIWVAARSGGYHFRHDGQTWRDTRDGEELFARLSRLLGEGTGAVFRLD